MKNYLTFGYLKWSCNMNSIYDNELSKLITFSNFLLSTILQHCVGEGVTISKIKNKKQKLKKKTNWLKFT